MKGLSLSRMPLKNLLAHRLRSVVLVLLAAAQAACVFGGAALAESAQRDLRLAEERLGADAIVYPYAATYKTDMHHLIMQGTPAAVYAHRKQLARVDQCDGIAKVTHQVYVPGPEGGPTWVIGFDPDTDFVLAPWTAEGREYRLPVGSAMVGANVGSSSGEVELYGRTWPIAAHLEKTGSVLDDSAFLCMSDMRAVVADARAAGVEGLEGVDPVSDYSALLVRVKNKDEVESVANWLKVYVRKTKTVQSEEALTATAAGLGWQAAAIGGASALAWAVLLAALVVAQSMAMRERAAELYVWRACGASRKAISRVVRREALIVQLAGALGGVALAALAVALAPQVAMPPPAASAFAALAAVALSAAAGFVSSSFAASRLMRSIEGQMLVAA